MHYMNAVEASEFDVARFDPADRSRSALTAEALFNHYHGRLTLEEAKIIADTIPMRGTPEWERREMLRQSIGNRCIGLSDELRRHEGTTLHEN